MKRFLPFLAGFTVMMASAADAQQPNVAGRRFSPEQVRSVPLRLRSTLRSAFMARSGIVPVSTSATAA